ncbi:MAG: hypothetical protein ACOH1Y_13215 [Propionicimonas sp.]
MSARWIRLGAPAGRAPAIVAIGVLLAGCSSGGGPMNSPGDNPRPTAQSATPAPTDVPPKRWAAIIGDLTARGIPTDAVALVSAKSVTWNNGALGCPQPGQSYTQALVPGLHVVVKVGTTEYDYRFGRTDNPRLCER